MADLVPACGQGSRPTAIRDTAFVLTLASTGARLTEIAVAELPNLHRGQSRLWLATKKGGPPCDAWIHPTAQLALDAWLDVRGPARVALFVPLSRTPVDPDKPVAECPPDLAGPHHPCAGCGVGNSGGASGAGARRLS